MNYYAAEASQKLVNPFYVVKRNTTPVFDGRVNVKTIEIGKVAGLNIEIMQFTTNDEQIGQMIAYLKELVQKGDGFYTNEQYEQARVEYSKVIEKINTKLSKEKQNKMQGFVAEVKKRIGVAYLMEYKKSIETVDARVKSNTDADVKQLEIILKQYQSIGTEMARIPQEYQPGLWQIKAGVADRNDTVIIAIAAVYEKNADLAFREYRFEDAIKNYELAKARSESIESKQRKAEYTYRYTKKIQATKATGESYMLNRVKSYCDQAEFMNLRDESYLARETMEKARQIMTGSPFVTAMVKNAFNASAEVIRVPKIGDSAPQQTASTTARQNTNAYVPAVSRTTAPVTKGVFRDNGNETVTDTRTGLMWVKIPDSKARTWQDATDFARSLRVAGFADWRLPTKEEFDVIVSASGRSAEEWKSASTSLASWFTSGSFTNIQANDYWTASSFQNKPNIYWYVSMRNAKTDGSHKSNYFYVWCVRGAKK